MNAAYTEEIQSGNPSVARSTFSQDVSGLISASDASSFFPTWEQPAEVTNVISISDIVNRFKFKPTIGPTQMPGIPVAELWELYEFKVVQREQLRRIEKEYVIEDRSTLFEYLKKNILLTQVLLEAVPYLRESFGGDIPLNLRFSWEDESSQTVYGIVPWIGQLQDARAALARFDAAWWRKNSHRAGGRIVFDYELA